MAQAGEAFGRFLTGIPQNAPRIPVIANVTSQPYPSTGFADSIRLLLTRQITEPVQWTQSIRYLLSQGVSQFMEIGPGNVLTRLLREIRQTADVPPSRSFSTQRPQA